MKQGDDKTEGKILSPDRASENIRQSGITDVKNAHASGDGSFKRSDEEMLQASEEKTQESEDDY